MPSRLLIEELPITATKPSAPGWAYVPEVAPLPSQIPGNRKRAAAQRYGVASSAKREKGIERRLEALNRENYKDVHIPIPKSNRERDQKKVTPNVRRILGYSRTFAHYLADEEAATGQSKSAVVAGEKLPAKTTTRIDPAKRKSRIQEIEIDDEPSPPPPPVRVRTPQPGPMKGRVLAVRCDECKRRKKRCTHMDIAEEQTAARARQMESPQPVLTQSRRLVQETPLRKLVDTPRASRASESKAQTPSVRKKASINALSQAKSTPSKVAKVENTLQVKQEASQEVADTMVVDTASTDDVTMTDAPVDESATQPAEDSATGQADSYPKEWDDDPLLRSEGVPAMPSDRIMQLLISEPPLSYTAARALPPDEEHRLPPRNFCSICGYWGRVKCGKCGEWTCGIMECWRSHEGVCEMAQYG